MKPISFPSGLTRRTANCLTKAGIPIEKKAIIKWGKDRGKNPPGSPWGEERDNDRHLTLAEKRKARET